MRNRHGTASANRLVVMVITFTVILFICAVSYVFYSKGGVAQTASENNVLATASMPSNPGLEKDSDGDGLADWEETLWSTDPNNADTDGNGVHDKEQVLAEKSLAAVTNTDTLSFQTGATDIPLTITEVASRELFASYMYSLQNGQTLSVTDQELMADEALQKIAPLLPRSEYTTQDVHMVPATQENKVQYATTLQDVLTRLVTNVSNETASLFKMAQGNRSEAIDELVQTTKQYRGYIVELKNISVPTDAVTMHTTIIVTLENYVNIIEGFTYFETDPMRSAVSIGTVQGALADVQTSFTKLTDYIIANHLNIVMQPQN